VHEGWREDGKSNSCLLEKRRYFIKFADLSSARQRKKDEELVSSGDSFSGNPTQKGGKEGRGLTLKRATSLRKSPRVLNGSEKIFPLLGWFRGWTEKGGLFFKENSDTRKS